VARARTGSGRLRGFRGGFGRRSAGRRIGTRPMSGAVAQAGTQPAVLMVAYHFPPLAGSSGIQRTLRFVQHLPALGWQPLVLTANARAYERTSDDLLRDVPPGTCVERAFALDTARHLSIGGRYIGAMARPDRWATWRYDAVRRGMALIRRHRPRVLWSTFPIPTAHAIGLELSRRSGLPWIADFRDPMAQEGYPSDPELWAAFDRLEKATVQHASLCVFTTPGAARVYRERYPQHAARIAVLENGYDEESFQRLAGSAGEQAALLPGAITLLHSGIVYPEERDPEPLCAALRRLKDGAVVDAASFRIRFRSPVHGELIESLAQRHGVADLIETQPPVPYAASLDEMLRADALLLMQGANCNEQIPAKTYEYLRAGRPILCLADPAGDTAGVVRDAGLDTIAALEDVGAMADLLARFVADQRAGRVQLPTPQAVARASRRGRSEQLVSLLQRVA